MSENADRDSVASHCSRAHTPGPWKVPRRFDIYQDLGPNVGGTYIGTTAGNRVFPESVARVDEANARLMAASPELLAACWATIQYLETRSDDASNELWGKVSAAYRKAIGAE